MVTVDKSTIIKILKDEIPSLKAIYIFGSVADGSSNSESDLDIAFLSDEKIGNVARWEISNKIANELNVDVDLVDISQANTVFRYQIVSKGERIYGGGYDIEEFEMLTFSFYFSFIEERKPIVDKLIQGAK